MGTERRAAAAGQAALLALAAGALGLALQIRDGAYHPSALGLVGVALLCALAAILEVRVLELSERALVALLAALGLGAIALLLVQPVARDLPAHPPGLWRLQLCLAGAAVAV